MPRESGLKRAFAFIDASNTRAGAKRAFGEAFGNFNPVALAEEVAAGQGWALSGVGYYLGVPDVRVTEDGHYTWIKRCARWRKQGVRVFTRTLLQDEDGVAREKGIDVRIALDAVGLYRQNAYDVALLFSQDQDFSELAAELKAIARDEKRFVEVVSAFPASEKSPATNGVSGMIPVPLDGTLFGKVLDTPENRRRVLVPVLAPLPKRASAQTQALPADAAMTRSAPAPKSGAPEPQSKHSVLRNSAGIFIAAYLAVATATLCYLTWSSHGEPLPVLAHHAKSAATWPAYWLGRTHFHGLALELPKIAHL